jgi:serine protease inhibitor
MLISNKPGTSLASITPKTKQAIFVKAISAESNFPNFESAQDVRLIFFIYFNHNQFDLFIILPKNRLIGDFINEAKSSALFF